MLFLQTRACTMTRTVTAQSWTIQAAQNPASLHPTGENLTPRPTVSPADPACECLFHSYRPSKTRSHDQGHCREAGNEGLCPSSQAGRQKQILGECSQKTNNLTSRKKHNRNLIILFEINASQRCETELGHQPS